MHSILKYTFSLIGLLFSLSIFSPIKAVSAQIFYVDANSPSSKERDGGVDTPWKTAQSAFQKGAVGAGDTVIFRDGIYGKITIKNLHNQEPVTIKAQDGHKVQFSSIRILSSSNWVLEDLIVNGSLDENFKKRKLVTIDRNSSRITLSNLTIKSIDDMSPWTAEDWSSKASDGIRSSGTKVIIKENLIHNIANGITVLGEDTLISGNTVDSFSGDGMRGLASNLIFEDNLVKNCMDVNKNHDDGFQAWSYGPDGKVGRGVISNVILRRNSFIASDRKTENFVCDMQGIGLFDGMYENWLIENNLVVVDHWHGITVMGAINVKIVNNTVYDPNNVRPGPANIKILSHKNGTEPIGSIIVNNIAASYGKEKPGVLRIDNLVLGNAQSVFKDAENLDFELLPDSPAKKQANTAYLPETDIKGRIRSKNMKGDLGAFQTP
jgi:preprotein translocase subunit YajC